MNKRFYLIFLFILLFLTNIYAYRINFSNKGNLKYRSYKAIILKDDIFINNNIEGKTIILQHRLVKVQGYEGAKAFSKFVYDYIKGRDDTTIINLKILDNYGNVLYEKVPKKKLERISSYRKFPFYYNKYRQIVYKISGLYTNFVLDYTIKRVKYSIKPFKFSLDIPLADQFPIKEREIKVLSKFAIKFKLLNYSIDNCKIIKNNLENSYSLVLKFKNLKAVNFEKYSLKYKYVPYLFISNYNGWKEISDILNDNLNKLNLKYNIINLYTVLVKNFYLVPCVYELFPISENTNLDVFFKRRYIFAKDLAYIFYKILISWNIKPAILYASNILKPQLDKNFPAIFNINSVIIYVPDIDMYFSFSSPAYGVDFIPDSCQSRIALKLYNSNFSLTKTKKYKDRDSEEIINIESNLKENGFMQNNLKVYFTGEYNRFIRSLIRAYNPKYLNVFYNQVISSIMVDTDLQKGEIYPTNYFFNYLNLYLKYSGTSAKSIGNTIFVYIPIFVNDYYIKDLSSFILRKHNIVLSHKFNEKFKFKLKVPSGYKLQIISDKVDIENDIGICKVEVYQKGDIIIFKNIFKINKLLIHANDYQKLYKLLKARLSIKGIKLILERF